MTGKRYAVIGHPVAHSVSPCMHAALLREHRIEGSKPSRDLGLSSDVMRESAAEPVIVARPRQVAAMPRPMADTARRKPEGPEAAGLRAGRVSAALRATLISGAAGTSGGSAAPGPASGRLSDDPIPPAGVQDSWKDVFASVVERLGEIREYAGYYVSTQTDAIKNKITWLKGHGKLTGRSGERIDVQVLPAAPAGDAEAETVSARPPLRAELHT